MKKQIFVYLSLLGLISCTARQCQGCNRATQFTDRNYDVKLYSGDSMVFHDVFHGIINQEEHSDGFYYFKGDTLVEIGGNYVIKSLK